jgi:hypothetical protein
MMLFSFKAWSGNLDKGVEALRSGNKKLAKSIFLSIPENSPEFFRSFVELQKMRYNSENWEKVFIYGIYYRQNFLQTEDFAHNFNNTLISIEVLTLAKHCQWDAASEIIDEVQTALQIKKMDTSKIERLSEKIDLLQGFQGIGKAKKKEFSKPKIKEGSMAWPFSQSTTITNPKKMRIKVENLCG